MSWTARDAQRGEDGGTVDREEFTSLYAASFPRLVGQLYAMTGDRAEAQDAVQEAFVRAWVHRGQIDTGRGAEAWAPWGRASQEDRVTRFHTGGCASGSTGRPAHRSNDR